MSFSATEAAFEGFRLVRRNPLVLVAWTLLYAVLSLATLLFMGPVLGRLEDWSARAEALDSEPSLQQVWPLIAEFGAIMGQMAWLVPVSLVVSAMLSAAVVRGVLKPSGGTFGYLRLGMDEVRVLVVSFVLGLLMTIAGMVAFVAVAVTAGLISASGGEAATAIVAVVGFIAVICLFIWLYVRLSLAIPITVAEHRFAFFDSFRMTRGRFWPLFGMAILAVVMVMLVQLLSNIVAMPLALVSGIQSWSFGSQQDTEVMRAAFDVTNPWVIAHAFVEAIVAALTVGVLYAPFAAAYRDIKGVAVAEPTA